MTLRTIEVPRNGGLGERAGSTPTAIPNGVVIVETGYFLGKSTACYIHVNADYAKQAPAFNRMMRGAVTGLIEQRA